MVVPLSEMDHLEYVRQRLRDIPESDRPRVAVDAGISVSTLYNVMKGERDAKYSTVKRLYEELSKPDAVESKK